MSGLVIAGLRMLAGVLLRSAMDKTLRTAVYDAVTTAEQSGLKGDAKMKAALEKIQSVGGKAVLKETESTLRTMAEQAIDHLKL